MTYFQDLDEMSSRRLMDELSRRRTDYDHDRCDYCRQPRSTKPCRFPERHSGAENAGPEIVVLCGSTRFLDVFEATNLDLTCHGLIVLSIGRVTTSNSNVNVDVAMKARLDVLHKRKIDLADRVIVLNVGGYIGESTRSEIEYATKLGKPIEYLEDPDA